MAVRGIHHDHVHTRFHQQFHALFGTGTHAHRCADAQMTQRILAGFGMFAGFQDVFHGHQPAQLEFVIHHQDALDAMLVHQGARVFTAGVFAHGNQLFLGRHDVADGLIQIVFKAQVAVGDDADQLFALNHRQTGNFVLPSQCQYIAHSHFRGNGDGVAQHATFKALDLADLRCLRLGGHVLVDDANPALLCQGNGQTRFGHRIHGGGQQRRIQVDVAGQLRAQANVAWQNIGISRNEQNVVEGKGFLDNAHGERPRQSADYTHPDG